MRRSKNVHPVVAYIWDHDDLGLPPSVIPASDFWPGEGLQDIEGTRYAILDWDHCPAWDVVGDDWVPRRPDRERLACGHEHPIRTWGKRVVHWGVRGRRRCQFCAMGLPPEPST